MFESIWSDIRNEWNKRDNYLIRIIFLNVLVFVVAAVLMVFQHFSHIPVLDWLEKALFMPSAWQRVIYVPWTIITSYFTQTGFMHILSNMIFLYMFGRIVDDLAGSKKVLSIYILGGIASSLTVLLFYNTIPYFIALNWMPLVGASGAVCAMGVAAATISPNYSINLIFLGPIKIKYIVAAFIFISFIGTASTNAGGNLAHLGGAFFGYIFVAQLKKGNDLGRPIMWLMSLFDRKPKMKITHRGTTVKKEGNETPNQEEIDRILDKINRSGYESLSKEEKQKLFKASQNQQ